LHAGQEMLRQAQHDRVGELGVIEIVLVQSYEQENTNEQMVGYRSDDFYEYRECYGC